MPKAFELAGQRFGMLIAVKQTKHNGKLSWLCKCDCGGTSTPRASVLVSGHTQSCGCQRTTKIVALAKSGANKTHGMRNTPTYKAWRSMKERCLIKHHKSYPKYGGRGIKICQRWLDSFENFYADMGTRTARMSLDRINNDGDYEPSNCRWASPEQQQRNKCDNVRVTAFGETKTVIEWLEDDRCLATRATLYKRISMGWNAERSITTPPIKFKDRSRVGGIYAPMKL